MACRRLAGMCAVTGRVKAARRLAWRQRRLAWRNGGEASLVVAAALASNPLPSLTWLVKTLHVSYGGF